MKKHITIFFLAISALVLVFNSNISLAQIPSNVPLNGLTSWYPFNGNANDQTANNLHFTVNGATPSTDRFGEASSAYQFNGSSNYLSRDTYTFGSISTVSFWMSLPVYLQNPLGNEFIGFGFGGSGGFGFKYVPERITWINYGVTGDATSSTYKPSLSRWNHYVFVKNGSDYRVFINGVLNSRGTSNTLNATGPLVIGAVKPSSTLPFSNFFQGKIDDLGIWNRVLTQEEIENLFDGKLCENNVTVTDTLVINTGPVQLNPVIYKAKVKLYPNPAKTDLFVSIFNLSNISGYSMRIINALGQQSLQLLLNQSNFTIPISTIGNLGIYKVLLVDNNGNTIESRTLKIE